MVGHTSTSKRYVVVFFFFFFFWRGGGGGGFSNQFNFDFPLSQIIVMNIAQMKIKN